MPSIALPVSLRGQLLSGTRTFSPASLFSANEPGVWFDPSDLTTLFQDPAGTTPVTAPGNTVGLMLDKSKGLALGANTATRANAIEDDTDAVTGWTSTRAGMLVSQSSVTTNSSFAFAVNESGGAVSAADRIYTSMSSLGASFGDWVKVTFDWRHVGVGASPWRAGPSATSVNPSTIYSVDITPANTTWRTETIIFEVSDNLDFFVFQENGPNDGGVYIDNFRVQTLAGSHATQAITTARPTYSVEPVGGRRNLLTWSEGFDNAVWDSTADCTITGGQADFYSGTSAFLVTATANYGRVARVATGISADSNVYTRSVFVKKGTASSVFLGHHNTATTSYMRFFNLDTLEITGTAGVDPFINDLGNGWYRIGFSQAATSTTLTRLGFGVVTSGQTAYFYGAQLELGSTATPYQRVTTQHDVTEAGVASLSYLYFDGVNDAMVTSTITPGIDKAQIFAGVRKLRDAASAVLMETSADVNANNGSLLLSAPATTGANSYRFFSKGSAAVVLAGSGVFAAAPDTSVITGIGDISGDITTLRRNGGVVQTVTTDQGTGNYLAYPLYIGARGGTSSIFTGHIYSLVVRFGANLDGTLISNTETWVAGKTGVTL